MIAVEIVPTAAGAVGKREVEGTGRCDVVTVGIDVIVLIINHLSQLIALVAETVQSQAIVARDIVFGGGRLSRLLGNGDRDGLGDDVEIVGHIGSTGETNRVIIVRPRPCSVPAMV